jgi:hypothetical protein
MQVPAGAACFVWEFMSLSMSILVDPLDVAFVVSIYIYILYIYIYIYNFDGGNWSLKVIGHQIQIN